MKIKLFLILLIISCYGFLNLNVVYSNEREITNIQKAIREKGAKWTVGKTSVSNLSIEEMKKRCGIMFPENYSIRKKQESIALSSEAEKSYFNWKDKGVVTPIKDQGRCGSCWAFAAVGAFESTLLINGISIGNDLSEQLVVSCNTVNNGCDSGNMSLVYNFLRDKGTTEESCFTYQALDLDCEDKCSDWEDKLIRTDDWDWVANNENSIKNALVENGPIPTTLDIYSYFPSYTGGVYECVSNELLGSHSVIIIGWDDTPEVSGGIGKPCWICKNSFGTGWGENGYFRIARGDSCNIGRSSACFYYSPPCDNSDDRDNEGDKKGDKKGGCFINTSIL